MQYPSAKHSRSLVICDMFKTSWQMGKLHTNGDSENHSKSWSYRSVQWLDVIRLLRRDQSTLHQLARTFLSGIFLGYALYAGGIWKGDILIPEIEELENMDASEIFLRRINAKEVSITLKGEEFIFPVADGTAKLSG